MTSSIRQFQKTVWDYYGAHHRILPWRVAETGDSFDPYKILVSEVMLQQTQVSRVIPKYEQFLKKFPKIDDLASAHLSEVLKLWSGLGYNRRAKYLHDAAKQLVKAKTPWTRELLSSIKGIGPNTAAAVCVYTYDQPLFFVETNIRTVFIHYFFTDKTNVSDKDLVPYIEQSLDKAKPREWYWALMDYGSYIKMTIGNASQSSKHYSKQSTFEGSLRQLRGKILRLLGEQSLELSELIARTADRRTPEATQALVKDGLVTALGNRYQLV